MEFIENHLLTLILFIPTVAALVLLLIPSRHVRVFRWGALVASLLSFGLTLYAWFNFNQTPDPAAPFQFEEQAIWYAAINSSYHLGIDGISLPMVLLTTLLIPLALLASFNIKERVKAYMILFLLRETGLLGVFMTLDLMLFFVFWEVGLVPMYFLIAQWGGANRNYASLKFILYTMGGSLGLLLAIQLMGVATGSFDLITLTETWPALQTLAVPIGIPVETVKAIAFLAFVIAFAIKVPIWPFHTWLPDAHTEAPTAGSMILAGVLLKLGAYGFLRLVLPLFPVEAQRFAWVLALLAVAAIIFGALGALAQNDFKRLVAYSSINHMGFVVLGVAAAAYTWNVTSAQTMLDRNLALNGAVLQMFNHGLSAAGMFFLVGVIYDQIHTRDMNEMGGLYALLPKYGTVLIFTAMASLGLPGLNSFISEFLVVRGVWPIFTLPTALSMIGLFFTGAYILKALKLVLHGPLNTRWLGHVTDINPRELVVMTPLMALMLLIGVWPSWLLNVINQAVEFLF
jgi:NADH-quinone oxidoreductase subunit M